MQRRQMNSTTDKPRQTAPEAHLTDATLWGETSVLVDTRPVRRYPSLRTVLTVVVSMLLGALIGALVMRQHYHAANVVLSVNGSLIESRDFYHRLEMA